MNRFFTNLQKQVKDRSTVIFGGAQSPTGSVSYTGSEKRPDDEDGEELMVSEAIEQALKTRNRGILKHIACLSPEAYSDVKELRVWASTFNVNGDKPQPDQDFRTWLLHPGDKWPERSGETSSWYGPDILFVGFQEINALNAISLVAGAGMENIDAWNTCIDCALNCKAMPEGYTAAQSAIDGLTSFTGEESPRHRNAGFGVQVVKDNPPDSEQYVHIGGRNLVGLYLSVWVRKPLLPHISSWQAGEVRTGTMGFGNKGAVMVRLRVFDEPLCCICAHIASGESAADALKRQADFLHICKTAAFSEPSTDNPNYMVHQPLEHDIMQGEWTRSILASQQPTVIFLGDFNFRIQGMPDAEVRAAVHSRNLDRILARDELAPAIDPASAAEGKAGVFTGWSEGFISFPPTFKYAKGSDRYVGDPLPDGVDAAVSEGPGRTLSGFSEVPGILDAASAATEPLSSSNAVASAGRSAFAEDDSTPAPPAEDAAADEVEDEGSHKVNLDGESPDATAPSSPKAVAESQVDNLDSAGAELDIAQSPGGSNEDRFEDGSADKDGAPGPPSAGGSVIGRVQSTLGRQSSMTQNVAAASTVPRERVRTPAWCDRIMYRCELRGKLAQLLYDRSELAVSDHKPVMSAFLLNAASIDPERLAHEADAAQKSLDLLANNAQPRCTVGENVLEVGELGYGEVVTRSVSLTCTGEVPAQWKITAPPGMELPDSSGPNIPPWVSIAPLSGMLTPGQTVEITFRVGVPDSSAATGSDPATAEKVVRRADAPGSLSHMCVLHIENGADHFVLVEGTYRASFFGLTISTLSEREAGMAEDELDPCECSGDNMKHIFASPFVTHQWAAIPQPLRKMLHFLSRDDCLVTPGIFSESFQMIRSEAQPDEVSAALNTEQPGRLPVVATVQAALDAGEKVPETATAHDVAATVLSYFKALPHPFFPESISAVCSASRPDANKAATTLKEALGGGAEWAVLCCTMRLLKLVIKVQADATNESLQERAKATFGGKVPTVSQRRSAIRSQLASCFADVWFPPINLEELDEHATADDYARLLQQAADASAKQAQFLQMFLM